MARRRRPRDHLLAAEIRTALTVAMRGVSAVGGLLLLAGIARSLGLIH